VPRGTIASLSRRLAAVPNCKLYARAVPFNPRRKPLGAKRPRKFPGG